MAYPPAVLNSSHRSLDRSSADYYAQYPIGSPGTESHEALNDEARSPRNFPATMGGETDPMLRLRGGTDRRQEDPLMPPPGLGDIGRSGSMGSFDSGLRSDGSMDDGDSHRVLYNGRELLGDRREASHLHHGSTGSLDTGEKELSPPRVGRGKKSRKLLYAALLLLLLVIIAATVAVPVAITNNKKSNLASDRTDPTSGIGTATSSAANPSSTPGDPRSAATGGDGSVVFTEDGSSFVYNNSFGGFWNAIPFNNAAQPQSDTLPLREDWNYSTHLIHGVNLGGWLVIEPFIVPALFEPFNPATNSPDLTYPAIDEWTLCEALGTDMASTIENHYNTFITEKDFAEIAAAGLNWVRIPVGFWMIEVFEGEPFLANVGWKYFLKAITWARKYGLRINLDLHSVPGSQNGYNHSSKYGTVNFLAGVMGLANAQRTLNIIRVFTEFINQPQYSKVVPMFSIMNEPLASAMSISTLRHFYVETYNMVREITGIGQGKGPFIVFHDGFVGQAQTIAEGGWLDFLPGADRVALDSHPYLCFGDPSADPLGFQATKPCTYWANPWNNTQGVYGLYVGAEWSLAINDCGKWINNVGNGQRFDGTFVAPRSPPGTAPQYAAVGSCDEFNDWENYSDAMKAGLQLVATAHMDAIRNWFYWTWKTGYSPALGKIANPLWNYQLALENGFMPRNPRLSTGACPAILRDQGIAFTPNPAQALAPWMTGGAGAGTIQAPQQLIDYAWPPTAIDGTPVANLPTYTPTGVVPTLSVPNPTSYPAGFSSVVDAGGDAWEARVNSAGYYAPVDGCPYPNPWEGAAAAVPAAPCAGPAPAKAKRQARAMPTPPPAPRSP